LAEAENRRLVERLFEGLNARDAGVLDEVFTDDSVMAYPQSGEIMRGKANRRAVYAAGHGLPTIKPYRTIASGSIVVVEADLDYGDDQFQTVFVFECRDGKIAVETAYWAKPFPAAAWRAPWVEKAAPRS
jgi:ketosteroid isomerase-like protein